jgi:hypothetical protein
VELQDFFHTEAFRIMLAFVAAPVMPLVLRGTAAQPAEGRD